MVGEIDKYFSVDHEPALSGQPGASGASDPAESASRTDRTSGELEAVRDSVAMEPALPSHHDPALWVDWLAAKRRRCGLFGNLTTTLLAALLGGPFAVMGALISGSPGVLPLVYVVVIGPVVEELLKQSGMTYVLEKRPYRAFAAWQFVFAGIVSGLVFGAIENLVYTWQFSWVLNPEALAEMVAFRWAVCLPLHATWAGIASLGLVRAWRRHIRRERPAELSDAFGFFAVAIVLHGAYNLWATMLGPHF